MSTTTTTTTDATGPLLRTWWHGKHQTNGLTPVGRDEVRRSRKYLVSVSPADQGSFQESFVYETIPRNGNGKMADPADPLKTYSSEVLDDGVSVEIDAKINMAWTQFEYSQNVDVKIRSTDGSKLGPTSNVVIRPSSIPYVLWSLDDDKTIVIRVPYDHERSGRRFSVEFQNALYTYRAKGNKYVESDGLEVSFEPVDALLIFASPFIDPNLIPSQNPETTQVLAPGKIAEETIGNKSILYFKAGIYWVEKAGLLGNSHITLHRNTHTVYFEPGAYLKGAIEYTTRADFATIGHGVISGENYAYTANKNEGYKAIKSDGSSLRMILHGGVYDDQTWHCVGPTINAPPFNSVDLFPRERNRPDEENRVRQIISDHKQVGAFFFQTDGPQIYRGSVKNCFWHVNDDAIKVYHSNAEVRNITVWKCHNNPVIQMGWCPRDVSDVWIDEIDVIHTRYCKSESYVPSAIIGASPNYKNDANPKVDIKKKLSARISNLRCELWSPALLRISPLQNYDLTLSRIKLEGLHGRHWTTGELTDRNITLGQSLVGAKIGKDEDCIVEGQKNLTVDIKIQDWWIGNHRIVKGSENDNFDNWKSNQLGGLEIHNDLFEKGHLIIE